MQVVAPAMAAPTNCRSTQLKNRRKSIDQVKNIDRYTLMGTLMGILMGTYTLLGTH